MPKFLPRSKLKWIDLTEFHFTSNSSKGCVFEVNLKSQKELHELHDDYPLTLDKNFVHITTKDR